MKKYKKFFQSIYIYIYIYISNLSLKVAKLAPYITTVSHSYQIKMENRLLMISKLLTVPITFCTKHLSKVTLSTQIYWVSSVQDKFVEITYYRTVIKEYTTRVVATQKNNVLLLWHVLLNHSP